MYFVFSIDGRGIISVTLYTSSGEKVTRLTESELRKVGIQPLQISRKGGRVN